MFLVEWFYGPDVQCSMRCDCQKSMEFWASFADLTGASVIVVTLIV
jgi:hypothetical protein